MNFRVGIENNNDDRTIAWVLDHPGCFAYGGDAESACRNLEESIPAYADWIKAHSGKPWLTFKTITIEPVETFEAYFVNDAMELDENGEYMVESFFRHDWKVLTRDEIGHALLMLTWSRKELLEIIAGLSSEKLEQTYPSERWSINGILKHIATAEWWYLERLDMAFDKSELAEEPLKRLEQVRSSFRKALPKMENLSQVVGRDGEIWSPRKSLRRALWHERDHTDHIRKLL